jgi:hypothetical protein
LLFCASAYRYRIEDRPRLAPLCWPLVVYLVFMAITISSNKCYGWYSFPFWALLSIPAAWFLYQMVKTRDVLLLSIFCLLPLIDVIYWGALVPATSHRTALRLVFLAPIAVVILSHLLQTKTRKGFLIFYSLAMVAAFFVLMTVAIFRYWYVYSFEW